VGDPDAGVRKYLSEIRVLDQDVVFRLESGRIVQIQGKRYGIRRTDAGDINLVDLEKRSGIDPNDMGVPYENFADDAGNLIVDADGQITIQDMMTIQRRIENEIGLDTRLFHSGAGRQPGDVTIVKGDSTALTPKGIVSPNREAIKAENAEAIGEIVTFLDDTFKKPPSASAAKSAINANFPGAFPADIDEAYRIFKTGQQGQAIEVPRRNLTHADEVQPGDMQKLTHAEGADLDAVTLEAKRDIMAKREGLRGIDELIENVFQKKIQPNVDIGLEIRKAREARALSLREIQSGLGEKLKPKTEKQAEESEWLYNAAKIERASGKLTNGMSAEWTISFPDGSTVKGYRPVQTNKELEKVVTFVERQLGDIAQQEIDLRLLDDAIEGYLPRELSIQAKDALDKALASGRFGGKVREQWNTMLRSSGHRRFRDMTTKEVNDAMANGDLAFGRLLNAEQERVLLKELGAIDHDLAEFFDLSNPVATAFRRTARSIRAQSNAEFVDRALDAFSKESMPMTKVTAIADRIAEFSRVGEDVKAFVNRRDYEKMLAKAKGEVSPEVHRRATDAVARVASETGDPLIRAGALPLEDLAGTKAASQVRVHFLDTDVSNELSRVSSFMNTPEALGEGLRLWRNLMQTWKGMALMAPAYHVRNSFSNVLTNMVAGVNPTHYKNAARFLFRKGRGNLTGTFVTKAGVEFTEEALLEMMQKMGILNSGQVAGELADQLQHHLSRSKIQKFNGNFLPFRMNRRVGMAIEDYGRVAHFLDKLHKTGDPRAAMRSVNKHLFNYNKDLGKVDRAIQYVVPFWRWTRNNIPLQIENFVRRPGRMAKINILRQYMQRGEDDGQANQLIPAKYIPQYMKDGLGVQVKRNKDGTAEFFLFDRWVPQADLSNVLMSLPVIGGTDEKTAGQIALKQAMDMVGPWKLPVEHIQNRSFFLEREIEKSKDERESFLGITMKKKTAHWVRGVARPLNELDKWNPGGVFGQRFDSQGRPEPGFGERTARLTYGRTHTADPWQERKFRLNEARSRLKQYIDFKRDILNKQVPAELKKREIERLNTLIEVQKKEIGNMAAAIRKAGQ
jgi:hypothetical protein